MPRLRAETLALPIPEPRSFQTPDMPYLEPGLTQTLASPCTLALHLAPPGSVRPGPARRPAGRVLREDGGP